MEATTKRFRKREAILACLRDTTAHPSAEWVYEQLKPQIPDLSLGTVYRNLSCAIHGFRDAMVWIPLLWKLKIPPPLCRCQPASNAIPEGGWGLG